MITINNNLIMQIMTNDYRKNSKTIGFVPTMGALHRGHLSLIKRARNENDIVIVSIFVNPLQFGINEDLNKYPRPLDKDLALCRQENVDIVFNPAENEFYEKNHLTVVNVNELNSVLCGKSRPNHFQGVTTVVNKFFNIIQPTQAYFGKKDFQQLSILKKMVSDLSIPVTIVSCPIIRDEDGLALSSRNKYLSNSERQDALFINKSLFNALELIKNGNYEPEEIKEHIIDFVKKGKNNKIDYVTCVDDELLKPVKIITSKTVIAIACYTGTTRLIDNIHCADYAIND